MATPEESPPLGGPPSQASISAVGPPLSPQAGPPRGLPGRGAAPPQGFGMPRSSSPTGPASLTQIPTGSPMRIRHSASGSPHVLLQRSSPVLAQRDSSKSTTEGEWEMRDGKWYRRDYYAIKPGDVQKQTVRVKCPNCPVLHEKIQGLGRERDELRRVLDERNRLLEQLKSRITFLEAELRAKDARIVELEDKLNIAVSMQETQRVTIMEKETIIIRLDERIKGLMDELAQKQVTIEELLGVRRELEARIAKLVADSARLEELSKTIAVLELELARYRAQPPKSPAAPLCPPPAPVTQTCTEPVRWYYAVQTPQAAQLFQMDQAYLGGDIVVDSLDGATIVNPEYYSQSERVAGSSRLRVRVVTAQIAGQCAPGQELFIRLRLGSATQFTQPRPAATQPVAWHQDFVFVGVPTRPGSGGAQVSVHPLGIEVVSRTVGNASEQIVATGTADLSDVVLGLTREVVLNLSPTGVLDLRIKALDFGLAAPLQGMTPDIDAAPAKYPVSQPSSLPRVSSVTRTSYYAPNAEVARNLDAADGVLDGKFRGADIYTVPPVFSTPLPNTRSTYLVGDKEVAMKLDAADGVLDGKYNGVDIRTRGFGSI